MFWKGPLRLRFFIALSIATLTAAAFLAVGSVPSAHAGGLSVALVNPSLEIDANGDGMPDCWALGGWGTSTVSWASTTDAHSGSAAMLGTISSWTDGDRKLLIERSPSCAPAATPGHVYELSAWYKGTLKPFLAAYWEDSSGNWSQLGLSPEFAATADWTEASMVTPAIPDGAVAISFGIAIGDVGSVTVDDFAISDITPPPPNPAPTVQLTAPVANASVSGTVTLAATAQDDKQVSRVEFLVNGTIVGAAATSPYTFSWDSRSVGNGTVQIGARAVDSEGAQTTDEHQVVVANTSPTTVSLTFDDGNADQFSARSLLSSHGMKGTFYLNSSAIGDPNVLSWSQVDQLAADGNEIGGHTLSHVNLLAIASDYARFQICRDRANLLQHGYAVRSFAYPYGNYNSAIQRLVADCGYDSARWTQGIRGSAEWCASNCPFAESMPPADLYSLRAAGSYDTSWTVERMKNVVTQAEQNGGGWVMFSFHHICVGCDQYSISAGDLNTFLDWLAARQSQGTVVKTVGEVVGGPVKPPVPSVLPPASATLVNPSLETDSDGNGTPNCWEQAGWGTNTGSWARTTDAHSGSAAMRGQISSWTTGDRQLIVERSPSCGVAVTPGAVYRLSAWLKSSGVSPFLVAYWEDSSGTWNQLGVSPEIASSSRWAQASWQTQAMPSGAVAIGFGIGFSGVGWVVADDLALDRAPSVQLTAPADGSYLAGNTTLTATALDEKAVSRVEFLVDNKVVATDTSAPYQFSWNSKLVADGSRQIVARAFDAEGAYAIDTHQVIVDNTVPTASIKVTGTSFLSLYLRSVTITLSATDGGSGVSSIHYTLDGSTPTTSSPTYTAPFVLTSTKTVRFRAWDRAGNASSVGSQTVFILF